MNIYDYQAAFGAADKTSKMMRQAMERWKRLYYQSQATEQSDPCQRIAYTVVSKLKRAVFAEYSAAAVQPVAGEWLRELEKYKEQAVEMAMAGGECYIKPYPLGAGFSYTLIPRANVLVFARDQKGIPTDVGTVERTTYGKHYYTLLERRTLQGGRLTIENKLYRANTQDVLGEPVALHSCPLYGVLPEKHRYELPHLGLVRMKSPTPNCIDGSPDGVAVFAPAAQLIAAIDQNEAQMAGEFSRGQSRVFVSRDLLDENKNLNESLFVGLDEDPETVGITLFSPQLREEAYLARKQEYLRNAESILGLKRGMLAEVNESQRTATEISASQADYSLTVMELQSMWQQAVEETLELCRLLAGIYGLPVSEPAVTFDWGNGVLFDEEKTWEGYMAMVDKGLVAPEVALGWRFGMKAETAAERAAIRQKFMPNADPNC